MRIQEIYNILTKYSEDINIGRTKDEHNQGHSILTNLQSTLPAIRAIHDLDIIIDIESFKRKFNSFYCWDESKYTTSNVTANEIISQINLIKTQVISLINILSKTIPKKEGFIISVKLPDYETLSELPEFYKSLNFTLTSLVDYLGPDEALHIYSFENGSKWNEFLTNNKVTFELLMLFLTTATAVFVGISTIQKNSIDMKATLQSMHQNEANSKEQQMLDKLCKQHEEDAYNQYVNGFMEAVKIKEIDIKEQGKNKEEIKGVVRESFKHYVKLAEKGTEFYGRVDGDFENIEETFELIETLSIKQKKLNIYRKTELVETKVIKSLKDPDEESEGKNMVDVYNDQNKE